MKHFGDYTVIKKKITSSKCLMLGKFNLELIAYSQKQNRTFSIRVLQNYFRNTFITIIKRSLAISKREQLVLLCLI